MTMKFKISAVLLCLAALVSCKKETPSVEAMFSVENDRIMINEEIMVMNESVAEFTIIGLSKWEWDGKVSYENDLGNISFSEAGEYPITLTVYAEEGVAPSDSYTMVISVFDTNKAPVAEFVVPENIVQGTPVTFTDASTDDTGYITSWEWKFGSQTTSAEQNPTVTFNTYGEINIMLTVTDNYGESASVSRAVSVKQSQASMGNREPSADFQVPDDVIQYLPVKFTDSSSDEDGNVVSWLWEADGMSSDAKDAVFAFSEAGDVEVKLTVTDDQGGKAIITKNVTVQETYGHDMKIDWSQTYDTKGHVYWTSPAVSRDGSRIYVSSTGYNLVCFDALGTKIGSYNIGENGANPYSGASINNQSPTPSIDSEGNVIIPVQFYDSPTTVTTGNGGVYSIRPDCAGKNWYFPTGESSSYRFLAAPIFGDYIAICLRGNDAACIAENAGVISRTTGELIQPLTCDQGSYGGMAFAADGTLIYGPARSNAGYKVAVRSGNSWNPSANSDAGRMTNFLYNQGDTKGSQPAISSDGYVYLCVSAGDSKQLICACYRLSDYVVGSSPVPVWTRTVSANSSQCGYGAVLDKEGNAYFMGGNKVFRLNKKDGALAWEYELDTSSGGNIGVAAMDSNDFLYVCQTNGVLLKIASQTGELLGQIGVSNPKSCPTIAPDGSIYVTGNKDNMPVLYKISGTGACRSTAPGANWSQLGANPQKNGCAPTSNE